MNKKNIFKRCVPIIAEDCSGGLPEMHTTPSNDIEELGLYLKPRPAIVRSTFRLSQKTHNIIKNLGNMLGVKNPELFETLLKLLEDKKFAESIKSNRVKNEGIRKTYVVTKGTLLRLKRKAEELKTKRDILIEIAISKYLEILSESTADEKERYWQVQKEIMGPFYAHAAKVNDRLGDKLRYDDDPIVRRFSLVVTILTNLGMAIEHFLKDGTPIDPDDMSQQ